MKWSEWPGYRAGACWTRSSRPDDDGTVYTRPLGLLESGFDVGGQRQGQSDVHALLKVDLRWLDAADAAAGEATTSRERSDAFLERVLDAWTTIRARHPLLASFVRDAPTEALPGVPPREFVFPEPRSRGEALSDARRTVLLHDAEEQASLDAACLEVLDRYVLNGERVLLEQDACLARLVLVRRPEEPLALGLILVVAHVACDALSVFRILRELFEEVTASPLLCGEASSPPLTNLREHLASRQKPIDAFRWQSSPPPLAKSPIPARLPLASEEHYPIIPISNLPQVSPARQKWFWAFKRVVLLGKQDRYPVTLPFPRLELGALASDPPQPRGRWPRLRFERSTSKTLFGACKERGVSPSMLLYAMASLALAPILARTHQNEAYRPVVLGFPFSSRPFCDPDPDRHEPSRPAPYSDPLTDVALRITFGQIQLPHCPLDLDDPAQASRVRAQALRSARLAKAQFAHMLSAEPLRRSLFHAEAYGRILDRVLTMGGDNPIAYRRIPTTLNASMIGDVDRVLPTTFSSRTASLPASPDGSTASDDEGTKVPFALDLHDLRFGTRLHRGEGMLMEAYTWDGMLTVCLGVDDGLMRGEDVEELLEGIRKIGQIIAGA
ncbi:hypothetical protein JCM8202v2_003186 [Rhodotorula sphaerocarpa]